MNKRIIKQYLAEIGRKGGKRSRRTLTALQARQMVKVREAKRAFKRYQAQVFWSFDPELKITTKDVEWVAQQLMAHGDREAWRIGAYLCR